MYMTSILFLGNFGGGNEGQIKVSKLIEYLYEKTKFKFIIGLIGCKIRSIFTI